MTSTKGTADSWACPTIQVNTLQLMSTLYVFFFLSPLEAKILSISLTQEQMAQYMTHVT